MSEITFLDNVNIGKNNLWRYIITTTITWVGAFILALITLLFILIVAYVLGAKTFVDQLVSGSISALVMISVFGIYYLSAFLLFYLCMRLIHHKKLMPLINTHSKIKWIKILKGALLWFAILLIISLLDYLIDPANTIVSFDPNQFIILLILSLIIFPIQASFEEIFFRGYLMQGFGSLSTLPFIPLVTTSIIFAIFHYFNGATPLMGIIIVIQTFFIGITLGIIALGENRLETAMGVHIAQNIFVTAIISGSGSITPNLPSILTLKSDTAIGIPFFVPLIVLLAIIFWNKKENLFKILKTRPKINVPENISLNSFKTKTYINEKICNNCHTKNPPEAIYCKKCGIKLNLHKINKCNNCTTINEKDAIYCKECGEKIFPVS